MIKRFAPNYSLGAFRGDLFGGLTSAVVALPVSLAFGVASGLGAQAGLYAAVAVGFFAAVFGGTKTQISGPTAPMAVAMAVIVSHHAATLAEALTVVVMAGVLQILLGISKIGRFIAYTPYVVVSGFMTGIGVIVICTQLLPAIGLVSSSGDVLHIFGEMLAAIPDLNGNALIITLTTLAVAIFWPKTLRRLLPAPLAALIAGSFLGIFWLPGAPTIGAVPGEIPGVAIGIPDVNYVVHSIQPALILALLGSIDSLLTSLVADSMTGTHHDPDKELVGQGIGNAIVGMFGGVAGAASTLLTTTNIRSGGTTRVSGACYALIMLVVLLWAGNLLAPVPLAVLAGILIKVGWDIVDLRLISVLHRIRREQLVVMIATLLVTVLVDLVTGVAVGFIAAGIAHAMQIRNLELDSVVSVPLLDSQFFADHEQVLTQDPLAARVGLVSLRGRFTVASSRNLHRAVGEDIKDHEIVIFDFSSTSDFDDSAAMVISQLMDVAEKEDTIFIVMALSGDALDALVTFKVLSRVPDELIVETLDEAREVAVQLLTNRMSQQRG